MKFPIPVEALLSNGAVVIQHVISRWEREDVNLLKNNEVLNCNGNDATLGSRLGH